MDYFVTNSFLAPAPTGIQSTAGAIPVKNDKGELSMKKVKVHRYISGKRPDYAPGASSDEESEDDFLQKRVYRPGGSVNHKPRDSDASALESSDDEDPRLRRLTRLENQQEVGDEIRADRHRQIHKPEIINAETIEHSREKIKLQNSDTSEDEELSDAEIERRRDALKQRVLSKQVNEEATRKDEEEISALSSDDSSEYEEYTASEDESAPRLKPIFVRKGDRITMMEREKEDLEQQQAEIEMKKMTDSRKRQTLKMVEEAICREKQGEKSLNTNGGIGEDVCSDNENDEIAYEAWKLRELKRIKRDREEREAVEKERLDIERIRNLTDKERRQEEKFNPKVITNKAAKGKYKFMQKYYHRGVFYLDKEENIFKRDCSGATLEDQFDKEKLPKVMQVKNFGRSGRSKYTHLLDQDTTITYLSKKY